MDATARRAKAPSEPPVPEGDLRAASFVFQGEEFVVLSYGVALPPRVADLSRAELEVAVAILQGKSNSEIAKERSRSIRTVANQVASIFRKLRVASRFELAAALAGQVGGEP
jgi:DNA-binding NarL/FixJ family response regulator